MATVGFKGLNRDYKGLLIMTNIPGSRGHWITRHTMIKQLNYTLVLDTSRPTSRYTNE